MDCQVWEVSETQAAKALLTLNRLRGEDNRRKRAELVEELAQTIPLEELEMFLPEAVSELEDLLSILQLEEEEFERAIRKQIKDEEDSLPVPYGFMVPKADCAAVDASLAQFAVDGADPSQAFVKLCRAQLEGEVDHADIPSN